MTDNEQHKEAKKTAIKELRAQRKDLIAAASSTMKNQKKDINAIKDFLKGGAATIPDIAKGIDLPKDKTLWYVATMKKYGQIIESQKEGSFFKYALNELEKTQVKAEV
ncbi:MAG: winged helix-turn-helix domain-containing protein [Pseudomonadota bacterium]